MFQAYELSQLLETYSDVPANSDFTVWQCIIDKVFNKQFFEQTSSTSHPSSSTAPRTLTRVEENAVRYTAGFVLRKLLCKYRKQKSSHAGEFVECLQSLVMTDSEESHDQPDLSDTWLEKVDRGGLYKITGMGHRLFREIELASYKLLEQNFSQKSKTTTDEICQVVLEDSDVQFLWAIMAVDVSVENERYLLLAIVQQWVLVRGHSLHHKHMEQ